MRYTGESPSSQDAAFRNNTVARKPRGIKGTRKQDQSGHEQRTHVTDLYSQVETHHRALPGPGRSSAEVTERIRRDFSPEIRGERRG
jgi:hypothetical protein